VPTTIERSRGKSVLALLACVLFVVASLGILARGTATSFVVGVAGLVTFAGFGVGWVWLSLRRGPGLVVDEDGFDDASSLVSVGRVRWSDVRDVVTWGAFGSTNVVVLVRNPDEYLARLHGPGRWAARINGRMVGSPVTLASTGLRTSADDLEQLLRDGLQRYRTGHPRTAGTDSGVGGHG
jgi:hypothetical protein